jgi:predicted RNA binding protein YcfA (HicA-like mRNA interferase family)
MGMPRDLSGRALVHVLVGRLQYRIVHERGSHIVIETETPSHHRIAVSDHVNIRTGTLNAVLSCATASPDGTGGGCPGQASVPIGRLRQLVRDIQRESRWQ